MLAPQQPLHTPTKSLELLCYPVIQAGDVKAENLSQGDEVNVAAADKRQEIKTEIKYFLSVCCD